MLRALIVDDEELARRGLEIRLGAVGDGAEQVEDPEEGLAPTKRQSSRKCPRGERCSPRDGWAGRA